MLHPYQTYISHLKNRPGEELLDRYQQLDPEKEVIIELYQRAIIEKYAEEIGYRD